MNIIQQLDIVHSIPESVSKGTKSPIERARQKLVEEIDVRIELQENPEFRVLKRVKKRDGSTETLERKPRSWVHYDNEFAYIGVRFSNKLVPIGGDAGSYVRCKREDVIDTLNVIRKWVQSGQADDIIADVIARSKRGAS